MAALTGRVVGADGKGIAGAAVSVMAAPVAMPDIAQLTGPDGAFDIEAPAPGTYTIGASAPGGLKGEARVDMGLEDAAPVEIRLGL